MSDLKRLLATGSNGMMGSDILPLLSKYFEIIPTDQEDLDVRDKGQIEKFFAEYRPDWVLHMAAMTNLDQCEDEPELAFSVNETGTRNIASACAHFGSKLIYISTSGIFSGRKTRPYTENDSPLPQNVYGKSKYCGECAVREEMNPENFLILRAGWLFGGGAKDIKFVGKIYKLARERDEISAVDNISGSPNYTVDIGNLIIYLTQNNFRGVFHAANEGIATRFEIAVEIVKLSGLECKVVPVPASDFPTKAPRPNMEAIENMRLKEIGYRMRHWKDSLADYIGRLKCELQF
jgi:dTDP-4-dehydrorhamnose reductase